MKDEKSEKSDKKADKSDRKAEGKKAKAEKKHEAAPIAEHAQAKGAVKARLRARYEQEIVPALMEELGYKNRFQVPKLDKVVVNMGIGEALTNNKILEQAAEQLGALAGQKPVLTRARKSIANFKLREGQSIGCMVTLRSDRAYEFIDRLVSVALPRVRDFKGVSQKAFDGQGNYTLGIKEQIIFPEVDYDKVEKVKGLNVTIVTTARSDDEGRALLRHFGMPFRS